uniref:Uncharacterized protein n=1 Tax=Oryza nivara TaxID=4536 RepID=A0A0E0J9G9_ORYNI
MYAFAWPEVGWGKFSTRSMPNPRYRKIVSETIFFFPSIHGAHLPRLLTALGLEAARGPGAAYLQPPLVSFPPSVTAGLHPATAAAARHLSFLASDSPVAGEGKVEGNSPDIKKQNSSVVNLRFSIFGGFLQLFCTLIFFLFS